MVSTIGLRRPGISAVNSIGITRHIGMIAPHLGIGPLTGATPIGAITAAALTGAAPIGAITAAVMTGSSR